jgi:hypothetical protein
MTRMMSAFGTEVFMRRLFVAAGVVLLMVPNMISAQARVERNVVYGMYSVDYETEDSVDTPG